MARIKINLERIKDLSQDLESGFHVYINTDTGETKSVLNPQDSFTDMENYWGNEFKEIIDEWQNYEKIEPPMSYDSHEFMESFLNKVTSTNLKKELEESIKNRKSFSNFKDIVEYSECREDWFMHKTQCYHNYLVNHLSMHNIGIDE